mgnify:CR=1 FL=1
MNRKRKQREDDHIDETWLIPYADLLTLLLALFIVLFASSQIDTEKFEHISSAFQYAFSGDSSFFEYPNVVRQQGEATLDTYEDLAGSDNGHEQLSLAQQLERETAELEQLKADLDQYIAEHELKTQVTTELNHEQLLLTIRDNALFDLGSASVKPEARRLAQAISDILTEYPQFDVVVSGHTDNLPITGSSQFRSNWDLSAYRALNFMEVLLENEELDESRFSNAAYGEHRPIASNDTAEGRAQNRRVEVSIIRNVTVPPGEVISAQ